MRKRILGTIIAAVFFAVAAFAGANGLAETQAACEHSQVKDGACVDCNDPVECIEVEDASGTAKGTYSKLEDAAAAAGNGLPGTVVDPGDGAGDILISNMAAQAAAGLIQSIDTM